MRYTPRLLTLLLGLLSGSASANWEKVNDLDYTWGPFKIYNISLFTETGQFEKGIRPLMVTLQYSKPVDGRDFAISIARTWVNLGINLPKQDEVIEHLRKTIPDLKPNDKLSYISLLDRGYFVLNDSVIPEEFNQDFNEAILSVWLDPKIDFSQKLTTKKTDPKVQEVHNSTDYVPSKELAEQSLQQSERGNQSSSAEMTKEAEVIPSEKQEKPKVPASKLVPVELESPEKQVDPIGDPIPQQLEIIVYNN